MKPEKFEIWQMAHACFSKAETEQREGKLQEAANSCQTGILIALRALTQLSNELEMQGLSEVSDNVFMEFWERREKHHTPKEDIEWAKRTMASLCEALPPDTFVPIRT